MIEVCSVAVSAGESSLPRNSMETHTEVYGRHVLSNVIPRLPGEIPR